MAWAEVKIAVLPFNSNGIDPASAQTAYTLLRQEMMKTKKVTLAFEGETKQAVGENGCFEEGCAIEIGRKLSADQVMLGSFSKLGEKVIVQYTLLDVASEKILIADNTTANTIEDLELIMKRIAQSVVHQKSFDHTVDVTSVTEKENEIPRRRSARRFSGISFGYLYPLEGYDGDREKSFTLDFRVGYEMRHAVVGMHIAARKGFATNIFASYLLTKTDICPYIGGAFGFHWIPHDDVEEMVYEDGAYELQKVDKREDGFEVTFNGGVRMFRTYNFQVMLNVDYIMTFNDFDDRAIVLTIGLLR